MSTRRSVNPCELEATLLYNQYKDKFHIRGTIDRYREELKMLWFNLVPEAYNMYNKRQQQILLDAFEKNV